MIKYFKIFENSLCASFKKAQKQKEDHIENDFAVFKDIIGIDIEEYKYDVEYQWASGKYYGNLSLFFKEKELGDLLDVDGGAISFASQFTGYNNYEYPSEVAEVGYHVSDENMILVKKLFNLLDIKLDLEPENITDVFSALGNEILDAQNVSYEISYELENAIEYNCLDAIKNLPFELSYTHYKINNIDYDFELEFNFDDVEEYIEKNKLEDINTINDLIENSDFSEFDYEKLENAWESDYKSNFDNVDKTLEEELEKVIDALEEGMKEKEYDDPNQLNLFKDIDDEIIKKSIEHQKKKYNFQYDVFKNLNIRNLRYAQDVKGKILAWFKSYEYQKNFITSEKNYEKKTERFLKLRNEKIIHPAIEYEYDYLPEVEKYGL